MHNAGRDDCNIVGKKNDILGLRLDQALTAFTNEDLRIGMSVHRCRKVRVWNINRRINKEIQQEIIYLNGAFMLKWKFLCHVYLPCFRFFFHYNFHLSVRQEKVSISDIFIPIFVLYRYLGMGARMLE